MAYRDGISFLACKLCQSSDHFLFASNECVYLLRTPQKVQRKGSDITIPMDSTYTEFFLL